MELVPRLGKAVFAAENEQMEQTDIFSATLGICPPWQISDVSLSGEENRIDFTVTCVLDNSCACPCPCCGAACASSRVKPETWVHADYFGRTAYIHAQVPYITCPCCGTRPVERPWAKTNSRFILVG